MLGSERLTGATLDRLTHRRTIFETGRESHRLREARKRRRGVAPIPSPLSVDDGLTEGVTWEARTPCLSAGPLSVFSAAVTGVTAGAGRAPNDRTPGGNGT